MGRQTSDVDFRGELTWRPGSFHSATRLARRDLAESLAVAAHRPEAPRSGLEGRSRTRARRQNR